MGAKNSGTLRIQQGPDVGTGNRYREQTSHLDLRRVWSDGRRVGERADRCRGHSLQGPQLGAITKLMAGNEGKFTILECDRRRGEETGRRTDALGPPTRHEGWDLSQDNGS